MSGSIEDILNSLQGIGPTTPTEESGTTGTSSKEATGASIKDSIQKAEEKVAEMGIQAPGQPFLINPQDRNASPTDPGAFLFLVHKVQVSVVNNILESWAKGIEEHKKINKEDIQRAIRLGLDRVGQFASSYVSKDEAQVDGVSSTQLEVANLTAFTLMSAFTVTQLNASIDPVAMNNIHNLNPVVFGAVPPEMASSLAMTGALVTAGLMAPIFLSLAGKAEATKGNLPDGVLPTQLAYATVQMVQSRLVREVLKQYPQFAAMQEGQKADLIARTNLAFLLSSLTMFYDKETGWVTEEELASMISKGALYNKIKSENPNDPRLALVASIREEMKGLPAGDRENILHSFLTYFSKNPSYSSTRKTFGLLKKMWENMDYEQITENAV